MGEITLLEMTANVRQRKVELDAKLAQLEAAGYDWTQFAIAGDEAMQVASDGLRNAWRELDRLIGFAASMQQLIPPGTRGTRPQSDKAPSAGGMS